MSEKCVFGCGQSIFWQYSGNQVCDSLISWAFRAPHCFAVMAPFPRSRPGGICDKAFFSKWFPVRVKHCAFCLALWGINWKLGSCGRPHRSSSPSSTTRSCQTSPLPQILIALRPMLHSLMAFLLRGPLRWDEMLFLDVLHIRPGRFGAMSQRGRIHGWEKMHNACVEILSHGQQ